MFILEFDYRSDDGPRLVGPFPDREAAGQHAAGIGGTLSWSAVPLTAPADDTGVPFTPTFAP